MLLLTVQESVSVDSTFALGQVTSVPKEQNLPMLFNEGEDSQVTHLSWMVYHYSGLCLHLYKLFYTL